VIAFIGSVDDLTLFVPMLVGKGFDFVQLVAGALAAAFCIVVLCVFIGRCKPVADCLSKIPLCFIVIIFATVLLMKAFVFDSEEVSPAHHHSGSQHAGSAEGSGGDAKPTGPCPWHLSGCAST